MRLLDLSAEQMLEELEARQEAAIEAEAKEARAKASLAATEGAVIDELRRQGFPVEIAKRKAQGHDSWREAHSVYLEVWVAFKAAQAAAQRASKALELWRTEKADARKV